MTALAESGKLRMPRVTLYGLSDVATVFAQSATGQTVGQGANVAPTSIANHTFVLGKHCHVITVRDLIAVKFCIGRNHGLQFDGGDQLALAQTTVLRQPCPW